jgi:hypothetical protein
MLFGKQPVQKAPTAVPIEDFFQRIRRDILILADGKARRGRPAHTVLGTILDAKIQVTKRVARQIVQAHVEKMTEENEVLPPELSHLYTEMGVREYARRVMDKLSRKRRSVTGVDPFQTFKDSGGEIVAVRYTTSKPRELIYVLAGTATPLELREAATVRVDHKIKVGKAVSYDVKVLLDAAAACEQTSRSSAPVSARK